MRGCRLKLDKLAAGVVFPDIAEADAQGVLCVSREVTPAFLIAAYSHGIFPWPVDDDGLIPWFAPPRRALFLFDRFHVSKRTLRYFKSAGFRIRVNGDFETVMRSCGEVKRSGQRGTWITERMVNAYVKLFQLGYAECYETLDDAGRLVGGLYGVRIGDYFAGESMFHLAPNASKFALAKMVERLRGQGMAWMDVQVINPFLSDLGASEVDRDEFMRLLRVGVGG